MDKHSDNGKLKTIIKPADIHYKHDKIVLKRKSKFQQPEHKTNKNKLKTRRIIIIIEQQAI